ncbi:response regulator transcription factor [Trichocoleus sp. FACHB-591]|uniref:response regulator n=1 Tax=Trichocoleus sp. FACHB-591 TaxID=2692872 RepID=UPI001687371B|nr:response regulator transcription factor [Trichocoleus sp. FACHB-591]MBD2096350.1 response regulator transcription factor [Trichocoleus sp. FACHB-591]
MSPIQVALIEDHELTRMGLRITLAHQAGVQVIGEATNGPDALALLMTTQPDVALVDIQLPGFDGIELMRQFKQWWLEKGPKAEPTKVIMLTAQDNEETVLAAFAAGADSYCLKTVNTQRLLQAVQSTYEGYSWIDPSIARTVLKHLTQMQATQKTNIPAVVRTRDIAVNEEYYNLLVTSPLTHRELDILKLIVAGCSNAAISAQCYITVDTVKTHVRNIRGKLRVDCRTQAAVIALRSGLVS